MEEKPKMPSETLKVSIGDYEYDIKFPNNGKLIDIESYKVNLTNGASKSLLFGDTASQEAYMSLCAVATFEILIPDMFKNMNIKSLLDLNPLQSKQILKAYEKYYKWMAEWRRYINYDEEAEQKDEE